MRAILIDPFKKSVSQIDVPKGLDGLRDAVFQVHAPRDPADAEAKALSGESPGYVEVVRLHKRIDMWIDEEGLLKPWEKQRFFHLKGEPDTRHYAGYGVLLGVNSSGEDTADAPAWLTVGAVYSIVDWVEPQDVRVPAPRFFSGDELDESMHVKPGAKGKSLSHSDEWSIDNQPTKGPA